MALNGINVVISFVLGLPGENYETLDKTIQFAKELMKYNNTVETSCSIMMPVPGSTAFNRLKLIDGFLDKYETDLFDLEELKYDWVKNFTDIPYFELIAAQNEIISLFPLNASFAKPELHSAPNC